MGSGANVIVLHGGPGLGSGYLLGGLAMRQSLGDWDIFDDLGVIDAPTLILTGDASG